MDCRFSNLRIRNAELTDCELLTKWWNDGKIMEHAGFPLGLKVTEDEVAAIILKGNDDIKRLLILEYDDQIIGEMNYNFTSMNEVSIGIKLCEECMQNKGLGRRYLSLLINELFKMQNCKIVLDTNLNNTRAQHVYESLGFKKTAVNVDSWKNQLGELQSTVDYELIESDFNSFL